MVMVEAEIYRHKVVVGMVMVEEETCIHMEGAGMVMVEEVTCKRMEEEGTVMAAVEIYTHKEVVVKVMVEEETYINTVEEGMGMVEVETCNDMDVVDVVMEVVATCKSKVEMTIYFLPVEAISNHHMAMVNHIYKIRQQQHQWQSIRKQKCTQVEANASTPPAVSYEGSLLFSYFSLKVLSRE
ncbi:hypothetical protein HanIR_Chr14g0712901 [Helianthus annuus]|nr:hypothetical protein HanIR_Chr14g0712901 [Helianthus annuus]